MTTPLPPPAADRAPRISIVTSCFNAEETIGDTLQSVLGQQYPALEYIVVDGASRDGTLAVAQRHRAGLTTLVSEPDGGQYHGIQKGMAMASGEIMAWLNADDVYCPWTLSVVGEVFATYPQVEWLIGTPGHMNRRGQCTRVAGESAPAYPAAYVRNGWFRAQGAGYLQQESMFWRRSLWQRAGGLDLRWQLAADFELWCRFARHAELHALASPLALFRRRPGEQRSSAGLADYEREVGQICSGLPALPWTWRTLGGRSEHLRHLLRLLTWRRSPVIAWSMRDEKWQLVQALRPLAKTSWGDLSLELALRRS